MWQAMVNQWCNNDIHTSSHRASCTVMIININTDNKCINGYFFFLVSLNISFTTLKTKYNIGMIQHERCKKPASVEITWAWALNLFLVANYYEWKHTYWLQNEGVCKCVRSSIIYKWNDLPISTGQVSFHAIELIGSNLKSAKDPLSSKTHP